MEYIGYLIILFGIWVSILGSTTKLTPRRGTSTMPQGDDLPSNK